MEDLPLGRTAALVPEIAVKDVALLRTQMLLLLLLLLMMMVVLSLLTQIVEGKLGFVRTLYELW